MIRISIFHVALSVLILTVLAAVPGNMAAADEQPAGGIRATIESLLRQLDASQLAERTRAERSLLDLGPDVLAYLPPSELAPSVSVREAVKRIRVQLERRAARESALASHVQIVGDVTIAKLLKEIALQTRNRIELFDSAQELASRSIHVEFAELPFWEAIDRICRQVDLEPVFDPQRATLCLRPKSRATSAAIAIQQTGPFRIAVVAAEVKPIAGDPDHSLIRVSARVTLEPRLRPLFLHFAAKEVHAIDSTGPRLKPWNYEANYELPVGDAGREIPVQLDFLLPKDSDAMSIAVTGRLSVQLAAGTERIVFDQTSQTPGTVRRRGGVTVRLRDVKFEPEPGGTLNSEIGVAVSYDIGGPAFESHRTWMFHNAVYLETESHRRVDFTEYDTAQQADGAIAVDYRWEHLAAPPTKYHFVYEAPTLILDLPVELKLETIPVTRP